MAISPKLLLWRSLHNTGHTGPGSMPLKHLSNSSHLPGGTPESHLIRSSRLHSAIRLGKTDTGALNRTEILGLRPSCGPRISVADAFPLRNRSSRHASDTPAPPQEGGDANEKQRDATLCVPEQQLDVAEVLSPELGHIEPCWRPASAAPP